jgi:hypothetical protein
LDVSLKYYLKKRWVPDKCPNCGIGVFNQFNYHYSRKFDKERAKQGESAWYASGSCSLLGSSVLKEEYDYLDQKDKILAQEISRLASVVGKALHDEFYYGKEQEK